MSAPEPEHNTESVRHYETVLGTVWPVNLDLIEWTCRYAPNETLIAQRLVVASVVSAFDALTDTRISDTEATAKLKRARQAQRQAQLRPTHNDGDGDE